MVIKICVQQKAKPEAKNIFPGFGRIMMVKRQWKQISNSKHRNTIDGIPIPR